LNVHIDGDIFRYRCAFAAERNQYLVELRNPSGFREYKELTNKKEAKQFGERSVHGIAGASYKIWTYKDVQPVENALQIVKASLETTLRDIENKFNNSEIYPYIYMTGPKNFRDSIAKTKKYKGNREGIPKPIYYKDVGQYLVENYGAVFTDGYEADDAISMRSTSDRKAGRESIVVSNDKDLDQIPGHHYDWIKKEFYTVSPKDAKTRLYLQTLSGDYVDDVPGLEGIGESKAAAMLEGTKTPEDMVNVVWDKYKEKGQDYFLEQINLVYLLKEKDTFWLNTKDGEYWKDHFSA
jgi:5''-3'' exonuclease (including N-terminal domain of PolI)